MLQFKKYCNQQRFNKQYDLIYQFLLDNADVGYNEHFPWARFEWMMNHTMLEEKHLPEITLVYNTIGEMCALITFDTTYEDRVYFIHKEMSEHELEEIINYIQQTESMPEFKINSLDLVLIKVLKKNGYEKRYKADNVLETVLDKTLTYTLPQEYKLSKKDFAVDNWNYQLVIHKGFNHEGIPEKWDDSFFVPTPHYKDALKVFAIGKKQYCAHCGVWYTTGMTAYIEPVVTIPECRKQGLAKAVIYEALNRAKDMGAKRATVLSDQEFYYRIGFTQASEFCVWTKK